MSRVAPARARKRRIFEGTAVLALSGAFAVAVTALLAALAEANNWCCVHGWALAHGSGLVVVLLFGLVGYHIVRAVGIRIGILSPFPRFAVLPHAVYVAGALGTLFFTSYFAIVGLGAGVYAVVKRLRGGDVRPFGLVLIGVLVSALSTFYFLWLLWVSSYAPSAA